jgi:hypothetical protein
MKKQNAFFTAGILIILAVSQRGNGQVSRVYFVRDLIKNGDNPHDASLYLSSTSSVSSVTEFHAEGTCAIGALVEQKNPFSI